jgi:hypothetical protein
MNVKTWRALGLAALCAVLALNGVRADDKPTDEGKAEDFKGKSFDLKEKGKAAIILAFPSGKEALITVKSEKKSDVNLYVLDDAGKVLEKDESPGPDCEIKFKPKASGKYTLEIRNLGPGDNKSTLKVALK